MELKFDTPLRLMIGQVRPYVDPTNPKPVYIAFVEGDSSAAVQILDECFGSELAGFDTIELPFILPPDTTDAACAPTESDLLLNALDKLWERYAHENGLPHDSPYEVILDLPGVMMPGDDLVKHDNWLTWWIAESDALLSDPTTDPDREPDAPDAPDPDPDTDPSFLIFDFETGEASRSNVEGLHEFLDRLLGD